MSKHAHAKCFFMLCSAIVHHALQTLPNETFSLLLFLLEILGLEHFQYLKDEQRKGKFLTFNCNRFLHHEDLRKFSYNNKRSNLFLKYNELKSVLIENRLFHFFQLDSAIFCRKGSVQTVQSEPQSMPYKVYLPSVRIYSSSPTVYKIIAHASSTFYQTKKMKLRRLGEVSLPSPNRVTRSIIII